MWEYASRGFITIGIEEGQVGSSTMPFKVNPVLWENSLGNFKLAIDMLSSIANNLQRSLMQRDLSDSTIKRSVWAAIGYFLLGIKNTTEGLTKVTLRKEACLKYINLNPQILGELVQTQMRLHCTTIVDPYELIRKCTQGKEVSKEELAGILRENTQLNSLIDPAEYIGLAEVITRN